MRNHEGNKTGRQGGSGGDRDPKDAIMKGDKPAASAKAATIKGDKSGRPASFHPCPATWGHKHTSCYGTWCHPQRRCQATWCYKQWSCYATCFLHARETSRYMLYAEEMSCYMVPTCTIACLSKAQQCMRHQTCEVKRTGALSQVMLCVSSHPFWSLRKFCSKGKKVVNAGPQIGSPKSHENQIRKSAWRYGETYVLGLKYSRKSLRWDVFCMFFKNVQKALQKEHDHKIYHLNTFKDKPNRSIILWAFIHKNISMCVCAL